MRFAKLARRAVGRGEAHCRNCVTDRTALRRRETTDLLRAVLGRGWGDWPV